MLSAKQIGQYHTEGYLSLPDLVDPDWVRKLVNAASEFVERSRALAKSDGVIDIEPDHSADNPRLRRLINPADQHQVFAEFVLEGPPRIDCYPATRWAGAISPLKAEL